MEEICEETSNSFGLKSMNSPSVNVLNIKRNEGSKVKKLGKKSEGKAMNYAQEYGTDMKEILSPQLGMNDKRGVRAKTIVKKGYEMADAKLAIEYRDSQSYGSFIVNPESEKRQFTRFSLFSSNEVFKEYGLGIYLYLQFIRRLLVTLTLMSCIVAVQIALNYQGTGLSSYPQSSSLTLARTTLGNLSNADLTTYVVVTLCDILSMIVFFAFYLHWRCFFNAAVNSVESDENILNPAIYALAVTYDSSSLHSQVQSLQNNSNTSFLSASPNHPLNVKDLTEYINRICQEQGGVYEVQIVLDYQRKFVDFVRYQSLIQSIIKEVQLIQQTSKNVCDLQSLETQKEQLEQYLLSYMRDFHPIFAILHFSTLQGKMKYLNLCRKYSQMNTLSNRIRRTLGCVEQFPFPYKQGSLILKEEALPRPQEINWENMDVSVFSTQMRWCISVLLLLLSILVTSSIVALSTLYVSATSSCASFDSTTTLLAAAATGGNTLYCYCSAHLAAIYTDNPTSLACASLSNTIIVTTLLQITASVVSSLSNIILTLLVTVIGAYVLRPKTIPQEYTFVFSGVFLANYLNSVIMPLVLNGNIFGLKFVTYLSFLKFIDFSELSVFNGFTSDWFALISPYYLNLIIIGGILPLVSLVVIKWSAAFSEWKMNYSNTLQKEVNAKFTNYQFPIAQESSSLILYLFITVLYSGLIPLVVPVATVGLSVLYVCKRRLLTHHSTQIPANECLSSKSLLMLPPMMLLHALFTLWGHTTPGLFSQTLFSIDLRLWDDIDRIFADGLMLTQALAIAGWMAVNYTLVNVVAKLQQCTNDDLQVKHTLQSIFQVPFQQRTINKNITKSYHLDNHPKYGAVKKAYDAFVSHQISKPDSIIQHQ